MSQYVNKKILQVPIEDFDKVYYKLQKLQAAIKLRIDPCNICTNNIICDHADHCEFIFDENLYSEILKERKLL